LCFSLSSSKILLAVEEKELRDCGDFIKTEFDFVKFIGSYASIVEQFADAFEVQTNKNQQESILSEIFNRYHNIGKDNKVLFILIDEFGKFLEYASKNNPEKELYFETSKYFKD
jgi:hypothetical protein